MNDVKTHCLRHKRDTVVLVPEDLYTQCYGQFVKGLPVKGSVVQLDGVECRLLKEGEACDSPKKYESALIINPQNIDDVILADLEDMLVTDGLVMCVKI